MKSTRVCPAYGKEHLVRVNDILSDFDGYVFVERGERCDACGEEFPYEERSGGPLKGLGSLEFGPSP